MDNRPLKFDEFENKLNQVVCVTATPSLKEIEKSCFDAQVFFDFDPKNGKKWESTPDYRVTPQVIRPTGLLDPMIIIKDMNFMIDDIMANIEEVVSL
jgi:excinuclease ABC subunit B